VIEEKIEASPSHKNFPLQKKIKGVSLEERQGLGVLLSGIL